MQILSKHALNDSKYFQKIETEINNALLNGSTGILKDINKEDVFYMLCFCLCVVQSRQKHAEICIENLRSIDFLNNDIDDLAVESILKKSKVRFHKVKTHNLVHNKLYFDTIWEEVLFIKDNIISLDDQSKSQLLKRSRLLLISKVKGFGMKLSSHFLRNIGFAGLAILDVHIIRGLFNRGLISDRIKQFSVNKYEEVEQIMFQYAASLNLTVDQLDQLMWSQGTGYIGK